jgi:hypothetical protein
MDVCKRFDMSLVNSSDSQAINSLGFYLYETETIDLLQDSVHKIKSNCIPHIIS